MEIELGWCGLCEKISWGKRQVEWALTTWRREVEVALRAFIIAIFEKREDK